MKKIMLVISLLLTAVLRVNAQKIELTGPYLGQTPPGMTPEIFAPGIVSLEEFHDFKGAFSADGKEYLKLGALFRTLYVYVPVMTFNRVPHYRQS